MNREQLSYRRLQPGSICRVKRYRFLNGGVSTKYVAIVAIRQHYYFVVLATSKGDHFRKTWTSSVFLKAGTVEYFDKDTWIDCDRMYKKAVAKLKQRLQKHQVEYVGMLEEGILQEILWKVERSRLVAASIKRDAGL